MGLLAGWKHCPRCRADLEGDTARLTCPSCGSSYYAQSVPAVSAIVVDGEGRVLLARRAFEPDAGLWDTPGGFLDELPSDDEYAFRWVAPFMHRWAETHRHDNGKAPKGRV